MLAFKAFGHEIIIERWDRSCPLTNPKTWQWGIERHGGLQGAHLWFGPFHSALCAIRKRLIS